MNASNFLDVFEYREGALYWKISPNQNIAIGSPAGYHKTNAKGYVSKYVTYAGKHYVEARVIFEMHFGEIPEGLEVDHADCNSVNNLLSNLRLATPQQQCINQLIRKDNKSGFKGVSWHKQSGKWQAQITIDGKRITLGRSAIASEAYAIYCAAAIELYGEFANLGGGDDGNEHF